MNHKLRLTSVLFIASLLLVTVNACNKEKQAKGTDKELYELAKSTTGFVWYKNTDMLLGRSAGSGHSEALLRTRYNPVAAAQLGVDGKVLPGAVFPDGSLIVKELHNGAGVLGRYAVLYKNPGSKDADAKGWVWGYINADGTVAEPASKKGSICTGCHLQADNIDYMLMNKYFP